MLSKKPLVGSALYILFLIVLLTPLPFGSNRPWATEMIAVLTAVMLCLYTFDLVRTRRTPEVPLRWIQKVAIFYAVVVVWIVIQLLPFTPDALHNPIWNQASGGLAIPLSSQISVNAARTLSALSMLLVYGVVFWISIQFFRSTYRAGDALFALVIAQLVYAVYGLAVQFSGGDTILWFTKWAYIGDVTSTFVNRNSYGTYVGLGLIVTIGLLLQIFARPLRKAFGFRQSALYIFHNITLRSTVLIVAVPILATALLLTHSRGGAISTGVGLAVLLAAGSSGPTIEARRGLIVGALIIIIGASLFALSGENIVARMHFASQDLAGRFGTYSILSAAISEFPLTGIGYGNYLDAFWQYRTDGIPGYWDKAHNTYLELSIELGLPAAASLIAANLGIALLCLRGIRRRRRNEFLPAIGLASIALISVHSLVDFSVQIPAVAITYAFILGVCCSQSWRSGRVAPQTGRAFTGNRKVRAAKLAGVIDRSE